MTGSVGPGWVGDASRPGGWVLVRWEEIPEGWADQAVPMALLPLAPGEFYSVLERSPFEPELNREDRALAGLLARGLSLGTIAQELDLDQRTVERRVARLRSRFGVGTKSELVVVLAKGGF